MLDLKNERPNSGKVTMQDRIWDLKMRDCPDWILQNHKKTLSVAAKLVIYIL